MDRSRGCVSKYRRVKVKIQTKASHIAGKIVPRSQCSTYEIEDMGGHWDRHRQVNSTLFGLLGSASETENIVRSCSTLLATALVSLMLSGCLFIPIPIGTVYSPATAYQKPEGSVTSPEEAMTAPPTPLPSTPDGKLAAKKEHQESVKKRQERVGCKEQAEKLLSDADRRAYTKECMSKER